MLTDILPRLSRKKKQEKTCGTFVESYGAAKIGIDTFDFAQVSWNEQTSCQMAPSTLMSDRLLRLQIELFLHLIVILLFCWMVLFSIVLARHVVMWLRLNPNWLDLSSAPSRTISFYSAVTEPHCISASGEKEWNVNVSMGVSMQCISMSTFPMAEYIFFLVSFAFQHSGVLQSSPTPTNPLRPSITGYRKPKRPSPVIRSRERIAEHIKRFAAIDTN